MRRSYKVGKGKPPKEHQFKPGRSGNPRGRPRGSKNLKTDLLEELRSTIKVTVNGRQRTLTKQRAAIKRLANDALGGNARSLALLLNLGLSIERAADQMPSDSIASDQDEAILKHHLQRLMRDQRRSARNA